MALMFSTLSQRERVRKYCHLAALSDYQPIVMANIIGCSIRQLERFFQEDLGRTPQEFLRELKLIRAAQMMLCGSTIKETAYDFGYTDVSNFSRDIRLVLQIAPKDLRMVGYRVSASKA